MADNTSKLREEEDVFDEEQYNEEEDEDFNPEQGKQSEDEDEEDESKPTESSKQKDGRNFDYSRIESETGGLVRTRRAKLLEDELKSKRKYEGLQAGSISDSVKDIWNELKEVTNKRLKDRAFCGSVLADGDGVRAESYQEERILIKRHYKFAGETKHEERLVPISSSEAQEYLRSHKFQNKSDTRSEYLRKPIAEKEVPIRTEEERKRLRRPLKRPPYLEQIIAGSLKPKLTTLEKSSMDWATYVDKEGLNDELSLYNKDGYLAKQDFLNRVEMVKDSRYRELRQKQLAMQLQEQKQ